MLGQDTLSQVRLGLSATNENSAERDAVGLALVPDYVNVSTNIV